MLTGLLPYRSSSITECIRLHVIAPVLEPSSVHPAVPAALDKWVTRLLAKSPEARPASAEVARLELQHALRQLTTTEAHVRPMGQRHWRAIVAALLVLTACAGVTLALRATRSGETEPLMVAPPPKPIEHAPAPAAVALRPPTAAPVQTRASRKKPDVGTLTIKARQYSTSFQVDGHEWGGQPAGRTFEGIRAGQHHLLIRQNEKRFERDVVVEPGGSAVVEVIFR
jgi:hypothetical protein